MPKTNLRRAAAPAAVPTSVRPQIVASSPAPPAGADRLHEIKCDGHRLVTIVGGAGSLRLLSRNGLDRATLFRQPFGSVDAFRPATIRPAVQSLNVVVPLSKDYRAGVSIVACAASRSSPAMLSRLRTSTG